MYSHILQLFFASCGAWGSDSKVVVALVVMCGLMHDRVTMLRSCSSHSNRSMKPANPDARECYGPDVLPAI